MAFSFSRVIAASLALIFVATPAASQTFSDSFTFLKAVRERDADKVVTLVGSAGSTVINTRDRTAGDGALHYIARDRELGWLTFLLGKGARPDIQNNRGETPLQIAAQLGWIDGAQTLLGRRASVDLANASGETPLILAVQRRDLPMVRLLLSKGANPKKTDRIAGLSAIDYARRDMRAAAILKLLEAGAAVRKPSQGPKL